MNLLGIDIGGTKMALSIGNERGEIMADQRFPTDCGNPQATLSRAVEVANELIVKAGLTVEQIDAIGISSPGPMCSRRRMILETPNLKGWANFKIGDFFEEKLKRPVFMQNDANGAGMAEYLFGGCKGLDLVYVTMSTGIGGGIVANGKIVSGINDLGGEVGHITLDINGPLCGCGKTGCWEAYCGGKTMADHIRAEIVANKIPTAILDLVGGDPARISMKEICAAVRAGDAYACGKWDVFIEKMAQAVGILLQTLNPQAIVMGTIAIYDGDLFLPQMMERLPRYAWQSSIDVCRIEPSVLKNIGELSAIAIAIDGTRQLKKG
ncbi:MAG: ROK family protein [Pontiellaceae bacterium]|jgi:glucokinase|nr:ROK family protein [Pontiellaceae bacterium]